MIDYPISDQFDRVDLGDDDLATDLDSNVTWGWDRSESDRKSGITSEVMAFEERERIRSERLEECERIRHGLT